MEFSYDLTPEEWRRTSVACLHLGPTWPTIRWVRALASTVGVFAILAALLAVAWESWAGVACMGLVLAIALGVRVFMADRFRGAREVPEDAIAQGLRVTEEGLVDLVRADGVPTTFPWSRVTQLVDARWAWLVGVGDDEWLVLPLRILPDPLKTELATELTTRTGRTFEPLP